MPKKQKLSENPEYQKLINQTKTLNTLGMPRVLSYKERLPFDIENSKYKDEETGEILLAAKNELLIAVPREIKDSIGEVIHEGWIYGKHIELKASKFANHFLFCQYRAMMAEQISDFQKRLVHYWLERAEIELKIMQLIKKRKIDKKLSDVAALRESLNKLRI